MSHEADDEWLSQSGVNDDITAEAHAQHAAVGWQGKARGRALVFTVAFGVLCKGTRSEVEFLDLQMLLFGRDDELGGMRGAVVRRQGGRGGEGGGGPGGASLASTRTFGPRPRRRGRSLSTSVVFSYVGEASDERKPPIRFTA